MTYPAEACRAEVVSRYKSLFVRVGLTPISDTTVTDGTAVAWQGHWVVARYHRTLMSGTAHLLVLHSYM